MVLNDELERPVLLAVDIFVFKVKASLLFVKQCKSDMATFWWIWIMLHTNINISRNTIIVFKYSVSM